MCCPSLRDFVPRYGHLHESSTQHSRVVASHPRPVVVAVAGGGVLAVVLGVFFGCPVVIT